jgi:hypothetical protein
LYFLFNVIRKTAGSWQRAVGKLVAGNGAKFGFKRIASETWHWEYQI